MIRLELVCDRQIARPTSVGGACFSLVGHRTAPDVPQATAEKVDHAMRLARDKATAAGWIQKRQPGRTPATQWICPACQLVP